MNVCEKYDSIVENRIRIPIDKSKKKDMKKVYTYQTNEEIRKPTTLELFAGAGGLALGIEKAGFKTIGLVEFDKDASDTLRYNRPNWNVINDDIANISCLKLTDVFSISKGELDLLSGGAPCQSFSYAGKRLGLEDARGTLFYHYAKFLEQLQPKMFLFENVRGLLSHDKGNTYKTISNIFESCGYNSISCFLKWGNTKSRVDLILSHSISDIFMSSLHEAAR